MTSVLSPPEALWPREEAHMFEFKTTTPITVDDLESLPDELRIELHEGNLVIVTPPSAWHSDIIWRVTGVFRAAGLVAFLELGVKSSEIDLREPDVAVLKSRPDKKRGVFPPEEVLIVVEVVSKSSEKMDRVVKPLHYAKIGIPEYWRVEEDPADDDDALIHQHKLSADGAYVETGVVRLSDLESEATE